MALKSEGTGDSWIPPALMSEAELEKAGGAEPPAPPMQMSEAELEKTVRELIPRLVSSVHGILGDEGQARGIAHLTVMRLINEIRRGTVFRKPLIAWATVVARRQALDYLKSAIRRREVPVGMVPDSVRATLTAADPDAGNPGARLEFVEMLEAVRKQIADPRQALIWELRCYWELSGVEVAEALNVSEATVSRELQRALAKARDTPGIPHPREPF